MMAGAKINVKDKTAKQKKALIRKLIRRVLELTGNQSAKGENLID